MPATSLRTGADGGPTEMDFLRSVSADQLEGVNEDQAVIFGGELHDWGQRNVSRYGIAGIWVAFFQECQ